VVGERMSVRDRIIREIEKYDNQPRGDANRSSHTTILEIGLYLCLGLPIAAPDGRLSHCLYRRNRRLGGRPALPDRLRAGDQLFMRCLCFLASFLCHVYMVTMCTSESRRPFEGAFFCFCRAGFDSGPSLRSRMVRYLMTIHEACDLVVTADSHALSPKRSDVSVYVLNMGQPVRIVDLAERMICLSGLEPCARSSSRGCHCLPECGRRRHCCPQGQEEDIPLLRHGQFSPFCEVMALAPLHTAMIAFSESCGCRRTSRVVSR
jgi:hypothetical protein